MISHLSIKNFAIIEKMNVDFHNGLNILTGETGSGKSIIIEAINLALGSRADTTYVRSGKEKATIQLILDIDKAAILSYLKENDISYDNGLIITREIYSSGKSICKINDTIVSVSFLNKVCSRLADLHGQFDHQSLLNPDNHILFIDSYFSSDSSALKKEISELYHDYTKAKKELSLLVNGQLEAERKKDYLKYEYAEISGANLTIGEDDDLDQELSLLQNSEKITENLSLIYENIVSDPASAITTLSKSLQLLKDISSYDPHLLKFENILSDCYYRIEDISSDLRKYKDTIQFSPQRLNEIIERLDLINNLKRKYGQTIEKILEYKDTIENEISKIENSDETIDSLKVKTIELENELSALCQTLSEHRKKAASEIEQKINAELSELNFSHSDLKVIFNKTTDPDGNVTFTGNGIDKVEFLISTNKGEPPRPLSKIASGGELSRVMLAFKRVIGEYDDMPTMIFDEIDSGISGATASIVGRKLAKISKKHQIISITHLPQIAVMGDHNYRISKKTENEVTKTTVEALDAKQKVEEISRLLGGDVITATAVKNAEEMIKMADKEKSEMYD